MGRRPLLIDDKYRALRTDMNPKKKKASADFPAAGVNQRPKSTKERPFGHRSFLPRRGFDPQLTGFISSQITTANTSIRLQVRQRCGRRQEGGERGTVPLMDRTHRLRGDNNNPPKGTQSEEYGADEKNISNFNF